MVKHPLGRVTTISYGITPTDRPLPTTSVSSKRMQLALPAVQKVICTGTVAVTVSGICGKKPNSANTPKGIFPTTRCSTEPSSMQAGKAIAPIRTASLARWPMARRGRGGRAPSEGTAGETRVMLLLLVIFPAARRNIQEEYPTEERVVPWGLTGTPRRFLSARTAQPTELAPPACPNLHPPGRLTRPSKPPDPLAPSLSHPPEDPRETHPNSRPPPRLHPPRAHPHPPPRPTTPPPPHPPSRLRMAQSRPRPRRPLHRPSAA